MVPCMHDKSSSSSLQELDLYKKLSHRNVVGYIDSQLDEKASTLYIFLEYG